MRTLKTIFIALFILAFFVSCGNTLGPGESVSDYVELSSSGIDPEFVFLKESGGSATYEYSNIEYNVFANKVSFDLLVTFDNGHIYDIRCSNIVRPDHRNVEKYRAEITVRLGSKTISGALFYPVDEDVVFIISVDPSAGLVPDVSTDFTVSVEYCLVSFDEGEICINFNDGDSLYDYSTKGVEQVTEGTGEHTFNVTATPKDWGEAGYFEVQAILYGPEWAYFLSIDRKDLLFEL